MLFDSSLRKELARSFGATLVVLVTVVMTMMLIRTLGQASRGSVAPADVLLVMGFTVLGQLPTILSLSLFVTVVSTLSRMYRDSEMVIWFSAGRGLMSLLGPLLRFSWPVLLVIAALSLVVWPWANRQIQQLRTQYEQRSDVDRIAPGEFQESANGARVFFIDKDTPDANAANNVFIATREQQGETVTSAQSARLEMRDGERLVLLSNGQRLETATGRPGLRISEFAEYGTLIDSNKAGSSDSGSIKTRDTWDLAHDPQSQAELGGRMGTTMAALNFVILGLAVAIVNPRAHRSTSLVLALLAFMVYYNLMTVGQAWVGAGRIGMPPFLLGLHGGTLALGLLLVTARHNHWSLRTLMPRRSVA